MTLPMEIGMTEIVSGGLQFKSKISGCYQANLHLRMANRVLMRLTEFKATNFRQLEKKLMHFPWELYLPASSDLGFNVKARHSRLYHTSAIAKRLDTCIQYRRSKSTPEETDPREDPCRQTIYLRAVNDLFVLSLDSSGDLLFKRGLKQNVGNAPIRETLAAAILKLADYDITRPLLDPMCGSGTFSLEAAMLTKNIPAGFFRGFNFHHWPVFSEAQWRHYKNKAQNGIKPIQTVRIFSSDINSKQINALGNVATRFEIADALNIETCDFFDLTPQKYALKPGLMVLNPPFGLRLNKDKSTKSFYTDIIKKLKSDFQQWRVAILVKDKAIIKRFPHHFRRFSFLHGGIDLTLLIGTIK